MARSWFPCIDTPTTAHPFSFEINVPAGHIAIAPGDLHKVVQDVAGNRTYLFRLLGDTPPCQVSLAAGNLSCSPNRSLSGSAQHSNCAETVSIDYRACFRRLQSCLQGVVSEPTVSVGIVEIAAELKSIIKLP